MRSSSSQGQQDPWAVGQSGEVERQGHLPQALHDPCEASAGVCCDGLEPIPGPGQGCAGEGAKKNGQHDTWTERELRGKAERVGDDNSTEKDREGT